MDLKLPVYAPVDIIPHGKRKPRTFWVREVETFTLKEGTENDYPVALRARERERQHESLIELRWDGENLYEPVLHSPSQHPSHHVTTADISAGEYIDTAFGHRCDVEWRRREATQTRQEILNEIGGRIVDDSEVENVIQQTHHILEDLVSVDGHLFETVDFEPAYKVGTTHFCGDWPAVLFNVEWVPRDGSEPSRGMPENYFRADDLESAQARAQDIAEDLGEEPRLTPNETIELVIPEALKFDPSKIGLIREARDAATSLYEILGKKPDQEVADTYVALQKSLDKAPTPDANNFEELTSNAQSAVDTLRRRGRPYAVLIGYDADRHRADCLENALDRFLTEHKQCNFNM